MPYFISVYSKKQTLANKHCLEPWSRFYTMAVWMPISSKSGICTPTCKMSFLTIENNCLLASKWKLHERYIYYRSSPSYGLLLLLSYIYCWKIIQCSIILQCILKNRNFFRLPLYDSRNAIHVNCDCNPVQLLLFYKGLYKRELLMWNMCGCICLPARRTTGNKSLNSK